MFPFFLRGLVRKLEKRLFHKVIFLIFGGDFIMDDEKSTGRRKFLKGIFAAAGATSATVIAGKAFANADGNDSSDNSKGPILYRRTREAERYYKTLY